MASAPPLGEVAVDVVANLDKLLADFAAGKAAAERWDQSMNRGIGQSVRNFTTQTDRLSASQQRLSRSMIDSDRAAGRYSQSMSRAKAETVGMISATETSMASLRRTLLGSAGLIVAALGVDRIRQMADSYTGFTNRLRSAGIEGENLRRQQEELFQVAQRYGVELESIGSLYGRLSQAQNDLGASNREIMQTVEGAAAAVRVYGASTSEQSGAIRQLSQMLGNAKVQMQEFNSLNDGARPILVAVANGIERFHGSVSALRAEVMRGGFETKEFFAGMQRGLPAIIDQANRMPLTIGASFQALNNALGQYIGQTDQALGATQRISAAIYGLASNLNVIMPILTAIILAIGARWVAALGRATVAMIAKTAVDAAAAVAQGRLAATGATVTTTLGVTTLATQRYAGALGVVTLEINAATVGLTRMQIAMATAGALAGRVGSAILAAFGGWVGVAIMAVVGTVILYNRHVAAMEEQTRKANEAHQNAVRLLREEADRGRTAGNAIRAVGQSHQVAAGYVSRFADATGDAADQLFRQARAAREARLETLRAAQAASSTSYDDLSAQMSARADTLMRGRVPRAYQEDPEWQALNTRAQEARRDRDRLTALIGQVESRPLEDELGPNRGTQGRDLAGEIEQRRAQLIVAQRNANGELERQLLSEIKLRQRIIALMETGLNFTNAESQATAEANQRGAGRRGADPTTTLPFDRPVPGTVLSPFGVQRNNGRFADGRPMPNHPHAGVDINAPEGTPVHAPQAGFARRKFNANGLGIYVEIDHGGGTRTRLAHLSVADVPAEGMRVERGQIVGRTGRTGNAAGGTPHLHYERREGGRNVNPLNPTGHGDPASLDDDAERAEEERVRHLAEYERDMGQLQAQILQATQGQTVNAAELAAMERRRINIQRDREKAEIEANADYTDEQRAALSAQNEAVRAAELQLVDYNERRRIEQETNQTREHIHETEIALLQSQQDSARTEVERRIIERRILAAQKAYERAILEATRDSPFTSPTDRAIAERDLGTLDQRYGAREGALNRRTRDELLGTAPDGSDTAHRQRMDAIRDQEAERLQIVQEALEARIIAEEEAARRRVEIETDAQNQIREAQVETDIMRLQSAQQTADALAQIATVLLGEHSRAARAMFIVSKGFAIAEAVIQLQVALAKALALGFPQNIPAIASVAALGATIVSNIAGITAQFEGGGWTGGTRGKLAGLVHGEEYVVRAPFAGVNRPLLDDINAGRDPTRRMQGGGGMGNLRVSVHNHAPGVEHEVRQIGPGEVEIIAKKVVARDAPGVVAADMHKPNSKTSKALSRTTRTRRNRP